MSRRMGLSLSPHWTVSHCQAVRPAPLAEWCMTTIAQVHSALKQTLPLEWFIAGATSIGIDLRFASAVHWALATAFAATCSLAAGTLVRAVARPMSCHVALETHISPLAAASALLLLILLAARVGAITCPMASAVALVADIAGASSTTRGTLTTGWSWHPIHGLAILLVHPLKEIALPGWT